jgi:hypothetical protein
MRAIYQVPFVQCLLRMIEPHSKHVEAVNS